MSNKVIIHSIFLSSLCLASQKDEKSIAHKKQQPKIHNPYLWLEKKGQHPIQKCQLSENLHRTRHIEHNEVHERRQILEKMHREKPQ